MLIASTDVPPSGWNSFDCYMGSINEEQALANLEVFLRKLKPAGYEYFCLDAAWYADGDQELNEDLRKVGQNRRMRMDEFGRYVPSPVNFPHGIRPIADRCHENGIKFGVHVMRGMPRMALERNTRIKGTDLRARDIYDPDNFCSWCKYWVAADASKPGVFEYYKSVVEYLTEELAVDFIKLDDVVEHPDHVALFAKAIDAGPRPVLLSLSPGAQDIWRGSWKQYEPYGNMIRVTADAWDYDSTNLLKLQRWYEFEELSGPGLWADLDMLPLGALQVTVPQNKPTEHGSARQSRLTPNGRKTMMTIFALSCSPLIFGGDLPQTPDDDIAWATHPGMLECNRNGIVGRRVSLMRHIDIRKAPRKDDPAHGWLGIFNINSDPRRVKLSPELLGFDRTPPLYNVWDDHDVYVNSDGILELYLPPYGCEFLKY